MDIDSLNIRVTTNGVSQAASDLDKLAVSGDKAAVSTDKLNKSFSQGQAAPVRQAAAALNEQSAALAKLAGQIDPTIAKLDKLDAMQEKLATFKKSGLIGADDFNALNTALDASRAKIGAAADGVSHFTLNNSLARRELGYLAKDLAMGNYGRFEQSALTLANASGVMKLAFSGMGAAVLAGVAAVALFAVGAIKGYEEAEKLRVSLIATGGAAGTGAVSLNNMANAVGAATGKWGDARKAVELFVASGKEAGAGLGMLAFDAVNIATVTGQSVEKVAQSLIDIGDAPAKAIANLNEQYHFLTAAQYAQIAALEDEGRTRDAARLAEAAYTSAMNDRAKEVQDNAGILIRAAHAVGDAWNSAWAAVKSVGAPLGLQQQVDAKQEQIDQISGGRFLPNGEFQQGNKNDPRVAQLQAEINDLKAKQVANAFSDNAKELAARGNSDAIAAQGRLSNFKTPKEQLDDSIKKANSDRLAALYGVVDPAEKAKIEARADQQIADAQKAYDSATKVHTKKASTSDPFASLNGLVQKAQVFDQGVGNDKADNAQVTAILAIVDAGAKLIASGQNVAKVQAQVAVGVAALNEGYAKQADQLHAKNVVAIEAYQAAMEKSNAALQLQNDAKVLQVSMGTKEYQQITQVNKAYQDQADRLEQIAIKQKEYVSTGGNSGLSASDAEAMTKVIQTETDKRVAIIKDGDAKMAAAQGDWTNGVKQAYANILDSASNVAAQTDTFFTSAFNNMGDALATFATTGKLNFKGFVNSVLTDLARMEAKAAESQLLAAVVPMIASAFGYDTTGGAGTSTYNSMGGVSHVNFGANAKGGVYTSPSLSAYSGQIVTQPTAFAFAKGAGIMGEAGPEAILPLSRGADGKLGVKAGGSGGDVNITTVVNVDSNGNSKATTGGDSSDAGRQLGKMIESKVRDVMTSESRPGGTLWRMQHA